MIARIVVVIAALVGTARADPLADVRAKVAACRDKGYGEGSDSIGEITKVEPIGKRPLSQAAHLYGAKARAYAAFHADGTCAIVPVVGKAAAALKGTFGSGGTVAYLVQRRECSKEACPSFVSIKTASDALVDAVEIEPCVVRSEMSKLKLHDDRDSIQLVCWNSSGADADRAVAVFDIDAGTLYDQLLHGIGIDWIQVDGDGPYCVAHAPGGITVAKTGAVPELDISSQAYGQDDDDLEGAKKAGVEWKSGGCEQTFKTQHFKLDAKTHRFVAAGPKKFGIATKLCKCPPGHK